MRPPPARALWAHARLGWSRTATNPLGLLGSVLLYWLILAIFWGLWSATPLHELGSAELTEDRLLAYLAVTEWIAFAVGLPYREVEAEIQSGTIDMRIARPIPFGLATLAIWVGEVGWGSANSGHYNEGLKGQAKLTSKMYPKLAKDRRKLGLWVVSWFDWRDPQTPLTKCGWCAHAGLFDSSYKPKPAWRAFRRVVRKAR